ncbi:MAG: site-specific integrase [Tenericutes bacterium]|nr:site-specific integrase [Mycoplasmatota bacterium]
MKKEKNITEIVPNKKYRISIEKGRKQDGTRNRITETFEGTLKQAIDRRDELLYEVKHFQIKPDSNMNFLEYAKLWLKDYAEINIKPSTLYGYKSCLNAHILPRFKDYKLSDITVYELEKFYNDLRKTKSLNPDSNGNHNLLSEAVVRHQHSLLCVMLNTAVKWDFINFNPCLKLTKPPTVTRKEMKFYDEEELKKLFQHLEYENLTFKTAIYLLTLGGMRRGECLGLFWENIDFEKKTITIKNNLLNIREKGVYLDTPKTKKSKRTISLPDICFDLLKKLKAKQELEKEMFSNDWMETEFVFKDEYGNYYNPSRLSRQWVLFQKKHNLKHIRLHDLRHTCATYLLSHNVPIATVSKKLGHSNIYTTLDVYTHSVDSDDIEASNLLNNMVIKCKEDVSDEKNH